MPKHCVILFISYIISFFTCFLVPQPDPKSLKDKVDIFQPYLGVNDLFIHVQQTSIGYLLGTRLCARSDISNTNKA